MNRKHMADIIRVLRAFTRTPEYGGWTAEPLGEGKQAIVYRVRRRNGHPAWADHDALVVKLFKENEPDAPTAAHDEYLAMSQLSRALESSSSHDWSISAPAPFFFCRTPLAVVMTPVSGRPVVDLLRDDDSLADEPSIAAAILSALDRFWTSSRRIYGDLNFSNILCDPGSRRLCFVDPGMPERCYQCGDAPAEFAPASRDLAYLLFESAAAVRAHLGEPLVRSAMIRLATRMIDEQCNHLDALRDRDAFLDEIRACAWTHLRRIKVGATPGGIWRRAVRRIAAKTIESTLTSLRAHTNDSSSETVELASCLPSLSK